MSNRFALFCGVALLFAVSPACAGEDAGLPKGTSLSVAVSPTRVTVGDRIVYNLTAQLPPGTELLPPSVPSRAGGFSITPLGKKEAKGSISYVYELRTYETGDKLIPAPELVFKNSRGGTSRISPGSVPVVVESVLGAEAKDIKDIKPPLDLAYFPAGLLLGTLAACAVAAAVILVLRRRKTGKPAAPSAAMPPHVIAYRALERLLAMKLISQGRVKEYYIRLSDIVRRYVEGRFGIKAPDRTTEEFLAEVGVSGLLDPRSRALIGDFLEQSDMVKFARYGPSDNEINGAYDAAKRFVDETCNTATKVTSYGFRVKRDRR